MPSRTISQLTSTAVGVRRASGIPVGIPGLGFGGEAAPDPYAANGFTAPLAADFSGALNSGTPFFRKQGSTTTLAAFGFPERSGLATLTNASGELVWNAHNLAVNSETPATQSITVVSGGEYTVEMEGSGSFALTGAGTGTASNGSPATITASTTTLTITLTGAADRVWVYRSDLGGMSDVEASYRTAGAPANYLATTGTARYLPRFNDHKWNGSAWVDKGALVEREARTNKLSDSNGIATWPFRTGLTGETNNDSPDGPWGADSLASLPISTSTGVHRAVNGPTGITAGAAAAFSLQISKSSTISYADVLFTDGSNVGPYSVIDVSTGAVTEEGVLNTTAGASHINTFVEDRGDVWRVTVVGTVASASRSVFPGVYISDTATPGAVFPSFTGNGTDVLYAGAADFVDDVLTPASHIPTNGAATARTADPALTIAAADAPYSASGLSLAVIGDVTYADEGSAAQFTIAEREVDANNYLSIDVDTDGAATGEVNANQAAAGTVDAATGATELSPGVAVAFGIASRHTAGAIQVATLGSAGTANTTPTALADFSTTDLDVAATSFMGHISRIVGWAEDIAEAGIEQASTEDNTAP